jgi:clan AA aspartic protease
MTRGAVNDNDEATVPLMLRGSEGTWTRVVAIIDTGFSGSLTIPFSLASDLALAHCGESSVFMADGSMRFFSIYAVDIEWEGSTLTVLAPALSEECLIGMRFLTGHELMIEVKPGGSVEIKKRA